MLTALILRAEKFFKTDVPQTLRLEVSPNLKSTKTMTLGKQCIKAAEISRWAESGT